MIHYGGHAYTTPGLWWCAGHGQECDPFPPVTTDDLLRLAACDPSMDDDAFAVLAQATQGREVP